MQDGSKLSSVSEAEVRAAFTARLGVPLTGQMLSSTLPYYPTLPSKYFILLESFVSIVDIQRVVGKNNIS